MAKSQSPKTQGSTSKQLSIPSGDDFMPETLEFEKVSSNILFWNFKRNHILYCKITGTEKLEYDVFTVIDLISGNEYYLPYHKGIAEAYDEHGSGVTYKIEYKETVTFKDGKKTFNAYDISVAKK